jgi:hypothetical protein
LRNAIACPPRFKISVFSTHPLTSGAEHEEVSIVDDPIAQQDGGHRVTGME